MRKLTYSHILDPVMQYRYPGELQQEVHTQAGRSIGDRIIRDNVDKSVITKDGRIIETYTINVATDQELKEAIEQARLAGYKDGFNAGSEPWFRTPSGT